MLLSRSESNLGSERYQRFGHFTKNVVIGIAGKRSWPFSISILFLRLPPTALIFGSTRLYLEVWIIYSWLGMIPHSAAWDDIEFKHHIL